MNECAGPEIAVGTGFEINWYSGLKGSASTDLDVALDSGCGRRRTR